MYKYTCKFFVSLDFYFQTFYGCIFVFVFVLILMFIMTF